MVESRSTYFETVAAWLANQLRARRELWFRPRVAAEPTEILPDGFFAEAQPTRNPSIAHPLSFQAQDGLIPLADFLCLGTMAGRSSFWARERAQPTLFEALLIAPKRSS
jgi:hypothetical protein